MLDGEHVWGSLDIWPSRHGVRRYRLVIFPPSIPAAERRLLRLWRAWATWGALLSLMSVIGLSGVLTPSTAIGISTTAYLGTGAVTLALAAHLRARVRTLSVAVFDGRTDRRSSAMSTELGTLASMLSEADAMRESGRLSPIDHEVVWGRVYDRLGPDHPEPFEEQAWI